MVGGCNTSSSMPEGLTIGLDTLLGFMSSQLGFVGAPLEEEIGEGGGSNGPHMALNW